MLVLYFRAKEKTQIRDTVLKFNTAKASITYSYLHKTKKETTNKFKHFATFIVCSVMFVISKVNPGNNHNANCYLAYDMFIPIMAIKIPVK